MRPACSACARYLNIARIFEYLPSSDIIRIDIYVRTSRYKSEIRMYNKKKYKDCRYMATVNPPDIERPKKYGRCGEIIHNSDDNIAKQNSTAPQVYGVQTSQAPVILNPLEPRPAIDIIHPMSIPQSDGTVKHVLLHNSSFMLK